MWAGVTAETRFDDVAPGRRVLLACDANICRSPMAHFLLAHALGQDPGMARWSVASAGTLAPVGASMCPSSARAISGLPGAGSFVEHHRSRPMEPDLAHRADLILVAATEERSAVASMVPDLRARLFTMREAALLAELLLTGDVPVDRQPHRREDLALWLNAARWRLGAPTTAPSRWRRGRRKRSGARLDVPDAHSGRAPYHRSVHKELRWVVARLEPAFLLHSPRPGSG